MCDSGAVGLNCSGDVECRYWVDARKQWEREGCLNVQPPDGKFDGYLHCECYLSGMFAGIVVPRVPPPNAVVYASDISNSDVISLPPLVDLPLNILLIITLAVLVCTNGLALGWAKFGAHRRALTRQRRTDSRRRLSRISYLRGMMRSEADLGLKRRSSDLARADVLSADVLSTAGKGKGKLHEGQVHERQPKAIQDRVAVVPLVESLRAATPRRPSPGGATVDLPPAGLVNPRRATLQEARRASWLLRGQAPPQAPLEPAAPAALSSVISARSVAARWARSALGWAPEDSRTATPREATADLPPAATLHAARGEVPPQAPSEPISDRWDPISPISRPQNPASSKQPARQGPPSEHGELAPSMANEHGAAALPPPGAISQDSRAASVDSSTMVSFAVASGAAARGLASSASGRLVRQGTLLTAQSSELLLTLEEAPAGSQVSSSRTSLGGRPSSRAPLEGRPSSNFAQSRIPCRGPQAPCFATAFTAPPTRPTSLRTLGQAALSSRHLSQLATTDRPVLPPLANKPSTPCYPYNRPAAARAVRSRVGQGNGHLPGSLPPSQTAGPAGYYPEAPPRGATAVDPSPPLPPSPPTSPPEEDSFANLTGEDAPPPRYVHTPHKTMHAASDHTSPTCMPSHISTHTHKQEDHVGS